MKKAMCLSAVILCAFLSLGNVSHATGLEKLDTVTKTAELSKTLETIKDNNVLDKNTVNIVSGLYNTYEPTFDTYRIVSGEAKEGTNVSIWKYRKDNDAITLKEITVHKIGASEIFSDLIELDLGKNYILVQGQYYETSTAKEFCLNRKNAQIKQKLKEMPLLFNYSKIDLGFLR